MDKTLYRADQPKYGNIYKISPTTLDDKGPNTTCFNVSGEKAMPVEIQGILPNLTNFKVK